MKLQIRILSFFAILITTCLLANCSQMMTTSAISNTPVALQPNPRHIALLLPLHGTYAGAGQAVRDGFLAAYYNTKPSNISPTIVRVYDTTKSSVRDLYQQALGDKADIVVGPLQKDEVKELMRTSLKVPVIALNFPPDNNPLPSGFYEFGLSPQNEAAQAASKAWNDGHRNSIMIYPAGNWGAGIANAFAKQWQQLGGQIVGSLAYRPSQDFKSAIKQLLQAHPCASKQANCTPGRRNDVNAIFLVAAPQAAQQIVPMLQFYYAGNIPTYATSLIYDGIPNPALYNDMNNVYFCDMPWVLKNNAPLQPIAANSSNNYQNNLPLYALGVDAFALTNQLNTLASNPNYTYPGVTGMLYMNSDHKIFRRLSWAQFRNGQVYVVG